MMMMMMMTMIVTLCSEIRKASEALNVFAMQSDTTVKHELLGRFKCLTNQRYCEEARSGVTRWVSPGAVTQGVTPIFS